MTAPAPLTVEQGRAMAARARAYLVARRVFDVVTVLGIVLFAVSFFELQAADAKVLAGGQMETPWLAWTAVFAFVFGIGMSRLMRHLVTVIHERLAGEQKRRIMDDDEPFGADNGDTEPAQAG